MTSDARSPAVGGKLAATAVAGCSLFLLGALLLYFWPWTSDDAYISFRYARNLAAGEGLVFNPGARVEGYSNFLLVLLLAGASFLSVDIVLAAKLIGLANLGVVLFLATRLAGQLGTGRPAALLALLVGCGSVPLAYWAVSGLEVLLYTALLLAAVKLYLDFRAGTGSAAWAVVAFLAVALTRAEGVVFFIATVAFHLVAYRGAGARRPARNEIAAAAGFALAYAAYLTFRYGYYGSLVPNTVTAKTGHSGQLVSGLAYVLEFLPGGLALAGMGLLPGRAADPARRNAVNYLGWLCLMWTGLVVGFGGDWMPLRRFFVPILPLLIVLAAAGFDRAWHSPADWRRPLRRAALLILLACAAALNLVEPLWSARPRIFAGTLSAGETMEDAARWLRANAGRDDVVAVYDAGRIPYATGLTIIDCAGLLEPAIARLPGKFEHKPGAVGYVLDRQPRFIELNDYGTVQNGVFVPASPEGFLGSARFAAEYRLVYARDVWPTVPGIRYLLLYERAPFGLVKE